MRTCTPGVPRASIIPPLAEQRRLVEQIEALADQLHDDASTLRGQSTEEAAALSHFFLSKPKPPPS